MNEVIPLIQGSGDALQGDDAVPVIRLTNWFCGLHSLIHKAECVDKAAIEAEKGHYEGSAAPILNPQFQVNLKISWMICETENIYT
jgi:hypothetical protein